VKYLRAANPARGSILGTRIGLADRWWLRFRGLMGREALPAGEGLILRPCRAVHMRGMAFPLDVVFLDWSARDALELPAGTLTASRTALGDTIVLDGA
jgi:uncharacterized membrane protein (UPF0127 family)